MIFAAGDLDGVLDLPKRATGLVAARFILTPGVTDEIAGGATSVTLPDPDALRRTAATRAFLRRETWTDLGGRDSDLSVSDITDRGLYVVNPSGSLVGTGRGARLGSVVRGGADGVVLHADFGLAEVAGRQVSTISATIGKVDYRLSVEESGGKAVDAIVSATTVASSSAGDNDGSTLVSSRFRSSAAGGGNPEIDDEHDGLGRLGFFVAQNAGAVFDDVDRRSPQRLRGGEERPVGVDAGKPDRKYGLVRLATAHRSFVPDRGAAERLEGYAAGWIEAERRARIVLRPFSRADAGPNLTFGLPDQRLNHISARVTQGGRVFTFGGQGFSAYVDDLTYGLLSRDERSAMALISAEPIGRELSGAFKTSDRETVPVPIRDPRNAAAHPQDRAYRHVQWGFFFGDLVAREGRREHVHLGTYAAGSPIDRAELAQARGTATYEGHAVGNVYNGRRVYSSIGTLSERFDFGRRSGTTTLDFDGRKYGGKSRLSGESYSSEVAARGRIGRLGGRFVGGSSGRLRQPNALIGGFELENRSNHRRTAYRATGTFAAERR
jgi:hypothetical protein